MLVHNDKRQRRRDEHDARRRAIVDATLSLMLPHGNPAVTMDEIAQQAGVSTASLYKYFPEGKDELYEALIDRVLDTDEEYLAQAFDPGKPPLEQLLRAGAAYARLGIDFPGFPRIVAQPTAFGPVTAAQAERFEARLAAIIERLAQLVAAGQRDDVPEEQRFAAHLDPHATARVLHGAWNGLIGLSLRDDAFKVESQDLADLAKLATRVVQQGMMSRRLDDLRGLALGKLAAGASVDDVDGELREEHGVALADLVPADAPR